MQVKSKIKVLSLDFLKVLLQSFVIFSALFIPLLSFAQQQDPGTGLTYECPRRTIILPNGDTTQVDGECTFNDLVAAAKNFLDKIIILALGFTVIIIAVAGFRIMISGDNPGERAKAKAMLLKVAIGIFFIIAAWLIVTLIANALLNDDIREVIPVELGN